MNKVILIGRLTKDPQVRPAGKTTAANYTLAVDRRRKVEGQPEADFIGCTVLGWGAEFAQKYLHKGMKIAVTGELRVRSYEKDGKTVWVTEVFVENQEFMESKKASASSGNSAGTASAAQAAPDDLEGFHTPDDIEEEELPFS